jgi:hypothetical protein
MRGAHMRGFSRRDEVRHHKRKKVGKEDASYKNYTTKEPLKPAGARDNTGIHKLNVHGTRD